MNQMQQLMMQAQKMQREMTKAQDELANKDFSVSKNGMVTIVVKGNKDIQSLNIDSDALEADNKEMLEETIKMAINEAFAAIDKESEEINSHIGAKMPMGF